MYSKPSESRIPVQKSQRTKSLSGRSAGLFFCAIRLDVAADVLSLSSKSKLRKFTMWTTGRLDYVCVPGKLRVN